MALKSEPEERPLIDGPPKGQDGGGWRFAIHATGLTRRFNVLTAVDAIALDILQGELFALLGPNGAGKTTIINMLCCLLRPTSGTASVMGYDILKEPFAVKSVIGVAPQETAVSEHLNAWENLSFIGRMHKLGFDELQRRSEALLERMGLVERADDQVRKYSGGMRRRLSLAMALIHDPQVLFLDEPTLGLDPQSRRAVWDYIANLKGNRTILLTTNYMDEADHLSDRIGIIDNGRIVALGTPDELKRNIALGEGLVVSVVPLTAELIAKLKARYSQVVEVNGKLVLNHPGLDLKEVVDWLHEEGVRVQMACREQPTLEDVFLRITGKGLRD